jgi:hypothetical protein
MNSVNFKFLLCCSFIAIFLSGCSHSWRPGMGLSPYQFSSSKAECSYLARHGGGGFYARGSQDFVAAAQLGYVLGETARNRADFDDCMRAKGWLIAD